MIKAKAWSGKDLTGWWAVTLKVDGVRAVMRDGVATSRAGKPLYNIPSMPDGEYEVYTGDFKETIEIVRASKSTRRHILKEEMYALDPIDPRLFLYGMDDPTASEIDEAMEEALDMDYEGLVLRQGNVWLKVKPKPTADVFVTGYQPGTGKHEGRMGALLTNYGKVGTGFTDADREWWAGQVTFSVDSDTPYVLHGKHLIEVEYMGLTPGGKFRHPRFVRIRTDKDTESLA